MTHRNRHRDPDAELAPVTAAASAGKASLTQRLVRRGPPPAASATTGDPVAAAVHRQATARALDAAFSFCDDLAPVQRAADRHTGLSDDLIATHAAAGVAGAGGQLPHLEAIQRAFGPDHDLSGVRAHVGGAAATAAEAIGAHAYATGDRVAFAGEPDLFLAAHEATHVVQQRHGVHLKGAVGQAGDPYEQHADQVAAAVVRGEDVRGLLGGATGGAGATAVQRWARQITSPSGAEITVTSKPTTVATVDGAVAGGAWFHETNLYGDTESASMNLPNGFNGTASIDFFATTDVDEGYTDWSNSGTIEINAVADVLNPGDGTLDLVPRTPPRLLVSDQLFATLGVRWGETRQRVRGRHALELLVDLDASGSIDMKEQGAQAGLNPNGKVKISKAEIDVGKDTVTLDSGRTDRSYTQATTSRNTVRFMLVLCPPAPTQAPPTSTPTPPSPTPDQAPSAPPPTGVPAVPDNLAHGPTIGFATREVKLDADDDQALLAYASDLNYTQTAHDRVASLGAARGPVALLEANKYRLYVKGSASSSGTRPENESIAAKRATAVASKLVKLIGIGRGNIEEASMLDHAPVSIGSVGSTAARAADQANGEDGTDRPEFRVAWIELRKIAD
jgi:outer membrane protein OmpA-like peptidoglycan-associated protein